MSDYFGALLRSTGVSIPAGGTAAAPSIADDPSNQMFEVEAGEARAVDRPQRTSTQDAAAASHPMADNQGAATGSDAPTPPTNESPLPPLAARLLQGDVHPAVRAALRWVTAAPQPGDEADPPAAARRVLNDAGPESSANRTRRAAAAPNAASATPAWDRHDATMARQTETAVTRTAPPAARIIAPPPAPRGMGTVVPTTQAAIASAHPAAVRPAPDPFAATPRSPEPVEVHIGSIHVQVDAAPAPRVPAAPAPARQPPQPARASAGSSGFARARLPRP